MINICVPSIVCLSYANIARNGQWDKQLFTQRILPVRIESLAFDDPEVLDTYFEHWDNKQKKWERLIQKRTGKVAQAQMDRFQKIKDIHYHWGDLADWLMDIQCYDHSPSIRK